VSRSMFWQIVRRDLRFSWMLVVSGLVLGIVGFAFGPHGKLGASLSLILLVTAGLAPGIFMCSLLIWSERKDKSRLFALSLPISPARYALAKGLAASIGYLGSWGALAAAALAGYTLFSVPTGSAPFLTVLWLFLLDLFCFLLSITLVSDSDGWFTAAIVLINTSIAPFIVLMTNIPSIGGHMNDLSALWSPAVFLTIAIEIAAAAAFIAVTVYRISRTRDFI